MPLETIYTGTSGLLSNAKGLQVVGNNLANVNTPGFKKAQLQFTNLVNGAGHGGATGSGSGESGTYLSFQAGADQTTGNPLDQLISGNGFFTLKRGQQLLYTRDGQFHFDDKGVLVNAGGDHVQMLDAGGKLTDVVLSAANRSAPKATTTVKFTGNITSTIGTPPVDPVASNIVVYDANGVSHQLSASFKNDGSGNFAVTVTDAAGATVGTGALNFTAGFPAPGSASFSFNYAVATGVSLPVKFDFSDNVTSLSQNTSVAVASQDGYQAGVRSDQSIEADGNIKITYSNGQTGSAGHLALANFGNDEDLEVQEGGLFRAVGAAQARYGVAGSGDLGTLVAGHREGSNVDMAEEFSNLILMQRGYQAASHVVSTANDMVQELFDMKGHR
jgi:flagellar hook protein FlgE